MNERFRAASRYTGMRCSSVSFEGMRCEREAGHTNVSSRIGEVHRAMLRGIPTVWRDRD